MGYARPIIGHNIEDLLTLLQGQGPTANQDAETAKTCDTAIQGVGIVIGRTILQALLFLRSIISRFDGTLDSCEASLE